MHNRAAPCKRGTSAQPSSSMHRSPRRDGYEVGGGAEERTHPDQGRGGHIAPCKQGALRTMRMGGKNQTKLWHHASRGRPMKVGGGGGGIISSVPRTRWVRALGQECVFKADAIPTQHTYACRGWTIPRGAGVPGIGTGTRAFT